MLTLTPVGNITLCAQLLIALFTLTLTAGNKANAHDTKELLIALFILTLTYSHTNKRTRTPVIGSKH
jgi:hypothetical protein